MGVCLCGLNSMTLLTYRNEVIHDFHWCNVIVLRHTNHFCSIFFINIHLLPHWCPFFNKSQSVLFNL